MCTQGPAKAVLRSRSFYACDITWAHLLVTQRAMLHQLLRRLWPFTADMTRFMRACDVLLCDCFNFQKTPMRQGG